MVGGLVALFALGSWWMATRSPNALNSRLETALAESANCDEVEWLLAHGANPNLYFHGTSQATLSEKWNTLLAGTPVQDEEGIPLLCFACLRGDSEVAGLLLKYGANPNITFEGGRTPLTTAISSGSLETIRLVLEHGGNPNPPDGAPLALAKVQLEGGVANLGIIALLKRAGARGRE